MTESELQANRDRSAIDGGVGSSDLATESSDPDELRALLKRARERLSFYEGFDRVIAENIRRSGELMLETLTMREQVADHGAPESREKRERVQTGLDDVRSGLDSMRSRIDSLSDQIDNLRASLTDAPAASPRPAVAPTLSSDVAGPASPARELRTGDTWASPMAIDVIAHGVTKAAIALSLQRYLGDLDTVVGVEAREFAEGVLRMQVTARQPLVGVDFTGWTECGPIAILQIQPTVGELDLG